MKNAGYAMNGISLHNYQFERGWNDKGDSVVFDRDGYYSLLSDVVRMDSIMQEHITVMDKHDPDKKVDLIVDEWGNWFNVMPGTNPGFLYQQNTIRDAISAMMMLHAFHDHCDRVHMANIAQMVNVLQAMVLTEGEKMVLTPTYYLFKMMKNHMDAQKIDVDIRTGGKEVNGRNVPKVSMSASKKNGKLTISLCNTDLDEDENVTIEIRDMDASKVSGEVMTAENMCDFNDFDEEEKVHPVKADAVIENGTVKITLPKMSVAVLTVE
jgi:alpha-N-arabinofuranosidase